MKALICYWEGAYHAFLSDGTYLFDKNALMFTAALRALGISPSNYLVWREEE